MQRTWVKYTRSLFTELLQDESNPDFVVEVVSLFFEDSDWLLDDLTKALDPQQGVDFKKVDAHVHQLKGSSSRSLRCLQQVKQEYYLVKNKLENLIRAMFQVNSGIPSEFWVNKADWCS
ncbi:Histidine-containing phosphotransfer protein 1 [Linum perenne]